MLRNEKYTPDYCSANSPVQLGAAELQQAKIERKRFEEEKWLNNILYVEWVPVCLGSLWDIKKGFCPTADPASQTPKYFHANFQDEQR